MGSIFLSGLRDQNNGKKIGINGSRIYDVTTLVQGYPKQGDDGGYYGLLSPVPISALLLLPVLPNPRLMSNIHRLFRNLFKS